MLKEMMPHDEWLIWRSQGIGSSDAAAIMGVSEWATAYSLWEEKCNLVKRDHSNWATQRGNEYEAAARASFELITGFDMPPMLVEHPTMPHLRSSLDGYSPQAFLEIKCPGKASHEVAKCGKVPEQYYPQIQHIFLTTGLLRGYYFSYDVASGSGVIVDVFPDRDYIEELVSKENKFWAHVTAKIPPDMTDRDTVIVSDPLLIDAAKDYSLITGKIKALEIEQEMLKRAIIDKMTHPRSLIGNLSVTRVVRKGNVDYSQIKDVDFEKYRKPDTSHYVMKVKE